MKSRIDKNEVSKFVGNRIKMYRKKRGITQKDLGEKLGVKHNTISSYENGTTEPEQNTLFTIAEILEVSINDFFPYKEIKIISPTSQYNHFDTPISAGLPDHVDAVTHTDKIEIPDSIMGRHAGEKDIFITKVNGQSMNRIIPDGSLIAVKPIDLHQIKQGDIVVYSDNGDYSVKRFYKNDDQLIFRPDSNDTSFFDYITSTENPNLKIHGKVVVYIVELD